MGKTKIPWCDFTFSPWWGCEEVGASCKNCYAKGIVRRFGGGWGKGGSRQFFGERHWLEPVKWNISAAKLRQRHKVFCSSMCDVFEDRIDLDSTRDQLLSLIFETLNLDWLLLTKRPEVARAWLSTPPWFDGDPVANIWLGVSVGNQKEAGQRIPVLVDTPAVKRFVSVEPMIGPVDLSPWLDELDWVICGDESGPKRRKAKLNWVRDLRDQCAVAGVLFFFKQFHFDRKRVECPELDGVRHMEMSRG